jgi:hypothetical protein
MSSPLDHIRLTLVELIDEMNDSNPDNVDSQAAATNICNIALSDLREDEFGTVCKVDSFFEKKVTCAAESKI